MQAADGGDAAAAGGDGGGEEGALVPTVFPPRRPKTYTLKKGQVRASRGVCVCVNSRKVGSAAQPRRGPRRAVLL